MKRRALRVVPLRAFKFVKEAKCKWSFVMRSQSRWALTHLFLDPLKLFPKFGIVTFELLHPSAVTGMSAPIFEEGQVRTRSPFPALL